MDILSDDIMREEFESQRRYEEELAEKWNNAKREVSELIHHKYFDFMECHDSYYSEGIVEIHEVDEKERGYPDSQRNCRIKNGKCGSLFMHTYGEVEYPYGEDGDYEGESVEYWVCQWSTGDSGDSYSGSLLLPLNDGRFWKVGYSC